MFVTTKRRPLEVRVIEEVDDGDCFVLETADLDDLDNVWIKVFAPTGNIFVQNESQVVHAMNAVSGRIACMSLGSKVYVLEHQLTVLT